MGKQRCSFLGLVILGADSRFSREYRSFSTQVFSSKQQDIATNFRQGFFYQVFAKLSHI